MTATDIAYDRGMGRWEPDAKGRLFVAARDLFAEQGFDETTVDQIARRAGVTERTFFRHFADKREVLFGGDWLSVRMAEIVAGAPATATPIEIVMLAVEDSADAITSSPEWSRQRQRIVSEHPDLQERELAKMAVLATVLRDGLEQRGVSAISAQLAAELGVLAFRLAYDRWATSGDERPLVLVVRDLVDELRAAASPA